MARKPLQVLSYAYRDISKKQYFELLHHYGGAENKGFRDEIEN